MEMYRMEASAWLGERGDKISAENRPSTLSRLRRLSFNQQARSNRGGNEEAVQ